MVESDEDLREGRVLVVDDAAFEVRILFCERLVVVDRRQLVADVVRVPCPPHDDVVVGGHGAFKTDEPVTQGHLVGGVYLGVEAQVSVPGAIECDDRGIVRAGGEDADRARM